MLFAALTLIDREDVQILPEDAQVFDGNDLGGEKDGGPDFFVCLNKKVETTSGTCYVCAEVAIVNKIPVVRLDRQFGVFPELLWELVSGSHFVLGGSCCNVSAKH